MTIEVGENWLGVDDVVRAARGRETVVLATGARARVVAARGVVMRLATSGQTIYGLNSALGANTGAALAPADLQDYQRRAVRARAVAVGPSYDQASVRAMQFSRIAGLARGGSGVSPEVLDACIALLNRQVHPVVPRYGSIGVADLPQLSHLALPLFGEGEAEFGGALLSGQIALERAGLQPVTLGVKDGLAGGCQTHHHAACRYHSRTRASGQHDGLAATRCTHHVIHAQPTLTDLNRHDTAVFTG